MQKTEQQNPAASLEGIVGLGKKRLQALAQRGIWDGWDVLFALPVGYVDTKHPRSIADLLDGKQCAVAGILTAPPTLHRANGKQWVKTRLQDESGSLSVLWFSMPWVRQKLQVDEHYLFFGRTSKKKNGWTMVNPSFHERGSITPQYGSMPGIPPKIYRSVVQQVMEGLLPLCVETLPDSLRKRFALMPRREAIRIVHQPDHEEELAQAKYRLAFEELLCYQAALRSKRTQENKGVQLDINEDGIERYWDSLPFGATAAQKRVLLEIVQDLRKESPMARMVQGDVGCGKTAIAFGAMVLCVQQGYQAAMMAPTEVLAQQHFENAQRMLAPLGIRCGLLTGKLSAGEKRSAHLALENGTWDVVVGTHALISEGVKYQRMGLVITDEQHRFGVRQRTMLSEKGVAPNVLVLSATPIPRSLALVLYGDLSISVVDELPPGRKPIKTHIVPQSKRAAMLQFLRTQVAQGAQVYFVCPLVEDSEVLEEIVSAESLCKQLREKDLKEMRIGCVHGQMKAGEKEVALHAFRSHALDVLVSTTVIEVGVDVPNASVMVIEDAFRFGLSQLHQLRGRVGRGERESFCFLMSSPNERLHTLVACHDGFEIAKKDMEMRGAGDFFGTRQHGQFVQTSWVQGSDAKLLALTQNIVTDLLEKPEWKEEAKAVFAHAQQVMQGRVEKLARN